MKILYISTVFPESKESSTIYTDLAEELAKVCDVTVLTNIEKSKNRSTYITEERGCKVIRIRTGNQYNVGFIEKAFSLLTMPYLMIKGIKKYLDNETYDLILYEAPPVTIGKVIKYAKKRFNAKTFLMLKDIFPQNAVDIGIMKKNSFVYLLFKSKEKELYSISDNIGCMSKKNLEYIAKHNRISSKLSILENTKKINYNRRNEKIKNNDLLIKYNIPTDKLLFIFGGNMGKPQGMDFLTDAIIASKNINDAFFILVGRGTEKEKVKQKLLAMNNCIVLDNLNRDDYERLLYNCDVGIISLDYRFTIPNYPSRILSYMEYEIPVLVTTDDNTDYKDLIEDADCGFWCPSNSIEQFVDIVKKYTEEPKNLSLGKNGFEYLKANFDVSISVKKIIKFMEESNESI